MIRKWVAVPAAVLASFSMAACGASRSGGGDSVAKGADLEVGTQVVLTGPASFVGQGFKVGATLAQDEINENGGINGRKLKLTFVDDKGTPDGGVAAVRQLVDRDKVLLVLGGSTSTATVAAVPYFAGNKKLYYASLASDPALLKDFHRNIFAGATISQTDGTKAYVDYITKSLGAKSVAMMECDQAHCTSGTPLLKQQLEAAGLKVPVVATYNSGDTDFTGQIAKIKSAKPEAVFIYGLAADGGRIIPQLRRAGVTVPLLGDTSLADPTVAKVAGSSAEGFTTFWLGGNQFLSDDTGNMADWLDSLHEHEPKLPDATPNLYSMMAYSDVYVLAEAIRQAGDDPTGAKIIDKLNTGIDGFVAGKGGQFSYAVPIALPRTFTSSDHQGNRTVTPITVENGNFVTVK
ncbi:ABC transporter substrate-binding protein [Micromonospora sp. NPDC005161]